MSRPHTEALALVTACDERFRDAAVNLICSARDHGSLIESITVYDLGLTHESRCLFERFRDVELSPVPPFCAHWRECWTWKPWVWSAAAERPRNVLYMDAASEIVGDIAPILTGIVEHGYFVVDQSRARPDGHMVGDVTPPEYFQRLSFDPALASRPVILAGLLGFAAGSRFHKRVVPRCLELNRRGYNLGWSECESHRNEGIHQLDSSPVRNCKLFRQDQTILSLVFHGEFSRPVIHSATPFPGHRPPRPGDVVWRHRKRTRPGPRQLIGELSLPAFRLTLECYGVTVELASDDTGVLVALAEMLPGQWAAFDGDPTVRFGLDSAGAISVDGRVVYCTGDRQEALLHLAAIIRRYIAERAPSHVFVHAGMVAVGDRGIVVPGPSRSGKTALVAELLARGATYYSDEYAVVDAEGMVHPFAKPLTVRPREGTGLPEIVRVGPDRIGSQPIRCRAIVIARYRAGARWEGAVRPRGEGAFALLENTVSALPGPAAALRAVATLARDAVVFGGERGEADEMADELLADLDGTIGGG